MLVNFLCPQCGNSITKLFKKHKDIPSDINCICGSKLERQLSGPTSKSTQIIDNGVQARQVEVMNEVVEQERERAIKGE